MENRVKRRRQSASPVPGVLDLLSAARRGLTEAMLEPRAGERYAAAHLAALRGAAAVLAARTEPAPGRRGPRSAWELLVHAAPEMTEWATFFAAGAGKRAAAEAGLDVVTSREADDLLRDAESFLALVDTTLGVPHQTALPRVS
jgi:SAV_6107-like HEPN